MEGRRNNLRSVPDRSKSSSDRSRELETHVAATDGPVSAAGLASAVRKHPIGAVAIATGQFGIVRLAAAGAGSGETNGTLVLEKYAIRLV